MRFSIELESYVGILSFVRFAFLISSVSFESVSDPKVEKFLKGAWMFEVFS